jgi:hypothetical protein
VLAEHDPSQSGTVQKATDKSARDKNGARAP